jgi:beta-carotene hydroxylase
MVFNNGFHTAHHENSGTHWSKLPELHAKIASEIDPELCQESIFWFCIKSYLLGIFSERFKTKQVGRAPYDPPDGRVLSLKTAEVAAVEAGVNASIAAH